MSLINMKQRIKNNWLAIALINLCIVAFLGMVLRSKILFSIPFIDFKNLLHAHSHFAFGGWVTLAIMVLMVYEILPGRFSSKPVYKGLFAGVLFNAVGMLLSFPFEGYGLFSIIFSTLFIFVSYVFTGVFIRHLLQSSASKTVVLLSIAALSYLALSSAGPFMLAYLLASKSVNAVLYKDAIYTYLHLQYNGFFTLAVFALFTNRVENLFAPFSAKNMHRFASWLNLSVVPSLFLCYMWHYPGLLFRTIAFAGSTTMLVSTIYFFAAALPLRSYLQKLQTPVRFTGVLVIAAFALKMLLQSLILVPAIGGPIFANRPVIIGFLHMVLLGFITLYLLAHLVHTGVLRLNGITLFAIYLFTSAVTFNTVTLMAQGGLGITLGLSSAAFPWILWLISIGLFAGAVLMFIGGTRNVGQVNSRITLKITQYSLTIKSKV